MGCGALGLRYVNGHSRTQGANSSDVFQEFDEKRQLAQGGDGCLRIPFHMDAAPIRIDGKRPRRESRSFTRRVNGFAKEEKSSWPLPYSGSLISGNAQLPDLG